MSPTELEPAAVRALTTAIADPREAALLIGSDNERVGYVSLDEAKEGALAFAVRSRDGVLGLDVDTLTEDIWAKNVAVEVELLGGGYIKAESGGGPDRYHYFLALPVGWTSAEGADLAQSQPGYPGAQKIRIERSGRSSFLRPPGSVHRSGGHGRMLHPDTVEEALRILHGRYVPLSPAVDDLVLRGDVRGRYKLHGVPSRSTLAHALCVYFINAGLPFEALPERLHQPHSVAGQKLRGMGSDGPAWLRVKWEHARQWVKDNPPERVGLAQLRMVEETARVYPWRGPGSTTDARVYRAMVARIQKHELRSPVVSVDQRTLAAACGCKPQTIASSVRRLVAAGLLSVYRPPGRFQATTYRLHPKNVTNGGNGNSFSSFLGGQENTITPHTDVLPPEVPDLFRSRRGNPTGAYETLLAIPEDWTTVADIRAARVGASTPRTVLSHLAILETQGLVERNAPGGHRWRRLPDALARLEHLALILGTSGTAELQRLDFQEQRHAYSAAYLDVTGQTRETADLVAS